MMTRISLLLPAALLLPALAACAASAQPDVAVTNSPPPPLIAVTNSPPPIVTVPYLPSAPVRVVPAPAPPLPVVAAPPQARRPAQSLISPDDYPVSALANREQGRVEFRLDVGPSGRVHGCSITRSSGSRMLDSTTCRIVRARSRFTPARDSNGMPVGYPVNDAVEWRLPERDRPTFLALPLAGGEERH